MSLTMILKRFIKTIFWTTVLTLALIISGNYIAETFHYFFGFPYTIDFHGTSLITRQILLALTIPFAILSLTLVVFFEWKEDNYK